MYNVKTLATYRKIMPLLVLAFVAIILTSCDPYYSITITNTTTDTATIFVKVTIHFSTDKDKILTTEEGFDVYKLNPKEIVEVGSAIAEIDNDIPFKEIKIVKNKDTISADNNKEIKKLFDKKTFGGLKTPYNISIK